MSDAQFVDLLFTVAIIIGGGIFIMALIGDAIIHGLIRWPRRK